MLVDVDLFCYNVIVSPKCLYVYVFIPTCVCVCVCVYVHVCVWLRAWMCVHVHVMVLFQPFQPIGLGDLQCIPG